MLLSFEFLCLVGSITKVPRRPREWQSLSHSVPRQCTGSKAQDPVSSQEGQWQRQDCSSQPGLCSQPCSGKVGTTLPPSGHREQHSFGMDQGPLQGPEAVVTLTCRAVTSGPPAPRHAAAGGR